MQYVDVLRAYQENFLPYLRQPVPGGRRLDDLTEVGAPLPPGPADAVLGSGVRHRVRRGGRRGVRASASRSRTHRGWTQLSGVWTPPEEAGWLGKTHVAVRGYFAAAWPQSVQAFSLGGEPAVPRLRHGPAAGEHGVDRRTPSAAAGADGHQRGGSATGRSCSGASRSRRSTTWGTPTRTASRTAAWLTRSASGLACRRGVVQLHRADVVAAGRGQGGERAAEHGRANLDRHPTPVLTPGRHSQPRRGGRESPGA